MEQYSYREFYKDLGRGREIHFIYKDEEYYIGRGTGKFMFWRFYDPSTEIIGEDVDDLLRKVKLNGKPIRVIWNLIVIDSIF